MIPWQNSWFQLSLGMALFSAGVLLWDVKSGRMAGDGMSSGTQTNRSDSSTYSNPAPVQTPSGGDNNSGTTDSSSQPAQQNTTDSTPPVTYNPPAGSGSYPTDGTEWQNSLGMRFAPAGTSGVLVSIWDTRLQDFRKFAQATGYNATAGVYSLDQNGWRQVGHTWSDPGFPQQETCPVVAVSWYDAKNFCAWLTQTERQANLIGPDQSYRLPTDAEWDAAAGTFKYPWGDAWPPAAEAGNYMRQGDGIPNRSQLSGTDGYAYTSPVASFPSNGNGIFDMGGDVWQWTEDWYRREMSPEEMRRIVPALNNDGGGQTRKDMRGGSFYDSNRLALETDAHSPPLPTIRQTNFGFRCVLVVTRPQ